MADNDFTKRIKELSVRSYSRGTYVFSDFLNGSEIIELATIKDLSAPYILSGGVDFAERKTARFGDPKELGYSADFPLAVIKIEPSSIKFAKAVTHRDFLGAILNLGIERAKVGDIFTDGKTGYAVTFDNLAPFVIEHLVSVGSNSVKCSVALAVPESFRPKTETTEIIAPSLRLDAVICKLYNLCRDDGVELFRSGKVFVNGKLYENNSGEPKNGDVVSVRGFGKFIFKGECGNTSKGKVYVKIEKFI